MGGKLNNELSSGNRWVDFLVCWHVTCGWEFLFKARIAHYIYWLTGLSGYWSVDKCSLSN